MTETTISLESPDITNFEKTLIITDGKIRSRTSRIDTPFDKTVRDPSQPDLSDIEYQNLVMTESEKKQYRRCSAQRQECFQI